MLKREFLLLEAALQTRANHAVDAALDLCCHSQVLDCLMPSLML